MRRGRESQDGSEAVELPGDAEMLGLMRSAQETVDMLHDRETRRTAIPDGWEMVPLEQRVPKEKITLRLDGIAR